MTQRWLVAAVLYATACSDAGSEEQVSVDAGTDGADGTDGSDGSDTTDGGDATDGAPACDPSGATEEYGIIFGQRNRIPPATDFDLYMMRPHRAYPVEPLTSLSEEEEGVTCALGCDVDKDLKWISVATEQAEGTGGYTIQFGLFNSCLEAKVNKGSKYPDVAHLEFAQDYLYFSQKLPGCTGTGCQFSVTRVNLNNPAERDIIIPKFPTDDDPDWKGGDSIYGGVFRVSPDANSVVLLSPTIRSQRVFLWTKGTLHQLTYLCDNEQNGKCIGAGSQYDDEDPVAISPDSKSVVLFAVHRSQLTVRRYSTENPDEESYSSIVSTLQAAGSYFEVVCAIREDWQPTRVIGQPAFMPDNKHLVFIGSDDCHADLKKRPTDLYQIDTTWIGDLTPVEESEVVNLTQNPQDDTPANKEIDSFAISPDGKQLIFSATPELGQNYTPFTGSAEARSFSDKELYKMSSCPGSVPEQITNDVAYETSRPRIVPLPTGVGCGKTPLPPP